MRGEVRGEETRTARRAAPRRARRFGEVLTDATSSPPVSSIERAAGARGLRPAGLNCGRGAQVRPQDARAAEVVPRRLRPGAERGAARRRPRAAAARSSSSRARARARRARSSTASSRLIESGHDPSRILLLTFTNKAAREMLRRVETLLAVDTRRLTGGTFHSVGNRLLRRFGARLGPRAELHDPGPRGRAGDARSRDLRPVHPDARAPLPEGRRPARPRIVLDQHGPPVHRRSSPSTPRTSPSSRPRSSRSSTATASASGSATPGLRRPAPDLEAPPRRVPEAAAQLAASSTTSSSTSTRTSTVSRATSSTDGAASRSNVMVVGDDAQSIYSFRGARFENILGFPDRHPEAQTFRPTRNYRSTPEILALANASIAQNARQFPKALRRVARPAGVPARRGAARTSPSRPLRRPARPRAARRGREARRARRSLPRALPGAGAPDRADAARDPLRDPLRARASSSSTTSRTCSRSCGSS